jgi:hypothetical protein
MKCVSLAVIGMLLSAPSWAGGAHFAPSGAMHPFDVVAPPASHGFGAIRPHDVVAPPAAHGIGTIRPDDVVAPPAARSVGIDSVSGPLVKPAWKD